MPVPPEHRGCRAPRERARRWLVRAIMVFYVALLAEGVLRKWIMPGASNALVFLRDPLMLLVLGAYAWSRPSPAAQRSLGVLFACSIGLLLCAGCQALTGTVSPLVLVVGLRNYLFFIPLCLAIRDGFDCDDYGAWLRLNLILAVPIAILVVCQYVSPPSALVNVAPGGSNDGVFLLVEDVVRPYGVFSFALGHSAFAAWMVGTVLAAAMAGPSLGLGKPMLVAGAISVAVMGVLSGSRTYFVFAASTAALFLVTVLLFGPARSKLLGGLAALGLSVAAAAALMAIPSLAANLIERQGTAVSSEGATLDRLQSVATDFFAEVDRVPVFGFGLGAGTNVANFLANGRTDHVLAEYELTRVVQELGPVFGLAYIALRWGLVAWFGCLTVGAARRGNLQPACFFGFLAPVFLAHDITLQNTMIGIGWFAAGVFLSAVRLGPAFSTQTVDRPPGRPARLIWGGA